MTTYQFKTTATMKPHNCKKWWIDAGIIREITTDAETVQKALENYQQLVKERFYIDISDNALKTKSPMYIDTKQGETRQTGFVITAKTDFQTDSGAWIEQYIDLWVSIQIVSNAFPGVID